MERVISLAYDKKHRTCLLIRYILCLFLCLVLIGCTTGCSKRELVNAYCNTNINMSVEKEGSISESSVNRVTPFSGNLAVLPEGFTNQFQYSSDVGELLLVNNDTNEILYSKDSMRKVAPASTTKLLTAYIILTKCNLQDKVTVPHDIALENGAVALFIKQGDVITVDELLHGLLIESANDCGVALAIHASGSVSEFAKLMNQTALELGATHSYFKNPHGLDEEGHYSCAYDLYLILKKDLEIPHFVEIVSKKSYTITYTNSEGEKVETPITSTNQYFNGKSNPPNGITILGGKTGTTTNAGHCLVLSAQNSEQQHLIGVVLNATDRNQLYDTMTRLLKKNSDYP